MRVRRAALVVFALLLVAVTWLTVSPDPVEAEPAFGLVNWIAVLIFGTPAMADKIAHFSAYAALGATAQPAQLLSGPRAALAPAALALYGAALEGVQGMGGTRDPSAFDALANALGVSAGYLFSLVATRIARRIAAA